MGYQSGSEYSYRSCSGSDSSSRSFVTAPIIGPASATAKPILDTEDFQQSVTPPLENVHKLLATLQSQTNELVENLKDGNISNNEMIKKLGLHLTLMEQHSHHLDPRRNSAEASEIQQHPDTEAEDGLMKGEMPPSGHVYPVIAARRELETVSRNQYEGLWSSASGSAIACPTFNNENVVMGFVNGDSENGSDYSIGRCVTRSREHLTHPRSQGFFPPTARRLPPSKSKPYQLTQPAKITKRHAPAPKANVSAHSHVFSAHNRPFTCIFARYGCKSTFGFKNDWKRHVFSIHLCLGIYQCDVGASSSLQPGPRSTSAPSSFHSSTNPQQQSQQPAGACGYKSNRNDLFTKHLNSMHHPANPASGAERRYFEKNLEEVKRRCWVQLREAPPRSNCGYCAPHPSRPEFATGPELQDVHDSNNDISEKNQNKRFIGPGSWDKRMEHVGRHLAEGTVGVEVEDLELRDWMLAQGLLEVAEGGWYRVTGTGGKRRGESAPAAAGAVVKEKVVEVGEEDADREDEAV